MFEYDQRVRGKRAKLPSAKRISLSGGGGDPTIQPMRTGSLSMASSIASSITSGWPDASRSSRCGIGLPILSSRTCTERRDDMIRNRGR